MNWDELERNYGLAEERFGKQRGQSSNPVRSQQPSQHKYVPISDDDTNSNMPLRQTHLHGEKSTKEKETIENLKRWFAAQESRYFIRLQKKSNDLMVLLELKSAPARKWIAALRRATEIAMADYRATEARMNKQVLAGLEANRAYPNHRKTAVDREEAEGKSDL